ncbi:GNAT family N-acetyltransferase [Konateibacter massiliensis]|uniref:GNAT family N-acetyltransferase n=1 Tax=Konateibacter massiliensis TaxID=2002841 RepID=UPI000C152416|nr:GNAT family N-acetyltransferase [Konateibacter massiliensis]
MEIRKSTRNDLDTILKLYEQARIFMRENGNPKQWGNHYPEASLIEEDIEKEVSFVCVDGDKIVGTFMYDKGPDKTYLKIDEGEWLNDDAYSVIHRITAATGTRGVASFCLAWGYDQCKNLKIDTHEDNIPMQRLLQKNGFKQCGIIYLENGEERIAFQKAGEK